MEDNALIPEEILQEADVQTPLIDLSIQQDIIKKMNDLESDIDVYMVDTICMNCKYAGVHAIPCGLSVVGHRCEVCGVSALLAKTQDGKISKEDEAFVDLL